MCVFVYACICKYSTRNNSWPMVTNLVYLTHEHCENFYYNHDDLQDL